MLQRLTLDRIRLWPTLGLALLVLLGGGFSAHAALIVWQVSQAKAATAAPVAAGFDRQDHFPGAALLYPTDGSQPAPAAGATGTIALPDLPIPAGADLAGDIGVRPAQPFSMANASAEARARAQQCLATAIYYEAASESETGQRAVAQVILNRVRHPAFPNSVCGVVYQGSERAGCQFSYACDGSMARIPSRSGIALANRYAAEALAGYVQRDVGEATHYHTYAVTPSWNRTLVMTAVIGAHFFHRWKGYWGTPSAFTQRYAGVEPLPGPHARIAPLVIAGAAPVATGRTPAPFALAAFADSGLPRAPAAAAPPATPASGALPESTMLDKWKGTGQPLR